MVASTVPLPAQAVQDLHFFEPHLCRFSVSVTAQLRLQFSARLLRLGRAGMEPDSPAAAAPSSSMVGARSDAPAADAGMQRQIAAVLKRADSMVCTVLAGVVVVVVLTWLNARYLMGWKEVLLCWCGGGDA